MELAATVDPGASVTFNFNVTAPTTVGTYDFQWRMVQNSTRFGALTTNSSVIVSQGNNAAVVSQSVVEVMVPGQVYPASVTMQNTGGTTWTPGSYFLGSENPEANTTWGLNRADLAVPIGPGAYVTLAFNVTAPSTVGVYNFQWRMVNNSTRFGAFTTNFPVDVVQGQAQTLYFVHTDHLNTPRLVADATGTAVWRWDQGEPFGNNPANENPSGLGTFDLPLRLPGQRYDQETGLHYNYFRDYDPSLGRYGESDPIGLRGGLNTYTYVGAKPLLSSDPKGLWAYWIHKMMTEEALERANCRIDGLPLETARVDDYPNSQIGENAPWHHMRRSGRSDAEAQADYDQYLSKYRSSCSLEGVARVLHAQQDSTSPSHKGMPTWTGDENVWQLIRHGIPDLFPNWIDWNDAVAKSLAEIEAFRSRCPCVCR